MLLGLKKYTCKIYGCKFLKKGALARWKFVSSVVGDSSLTLIYWRRHLKAAIHLAVSCSELYFVRCCTLKQTGKYLLESNVMCVFQLILKRNVLMFHSQYQCVNNYFETENFWNKLMCHKHFVYRACYIRAKTMVSNLKVTLETNFVLDLISLDCRLRLLEYFFWAIS